ncbi:methyl-accepting chemotaxis protein [Shewanella sp. NIFS-20-20]|uniref:methyl-accepting chemotaxis protein n=1 Tax=Shewanella sp. NIFS-20-20 TaxID=2853806 RepID=UPI001C48626E|nr:methyl-accepting chemotaxis protein [Shewanella sp. NIFS-20-20]MBV7316135.1 PAS domain S-box protein [Shewanella sp. NIFS-20-20]
MDDVDNKAQDVMAELHELTAKFNAISKVQAVIEFNMDGTIITANDNFLNAMGYRLAEVQGKHHSMFVDLDVKNSRDYQLFWQKLNRGEHESKEYRRLGKFGKEVWIQASYTPIIGVNGRPYKVVKIATDITEQKRKNADIYGQIDAISKAQAVIEFNMDGTIITANDNFLNTMGYRLDDIRGKHHSLFVEPQYKHSNEYKAFWQNLNRGEYDVNEYLRFGKDGKRVWIQASYNPIFDTNGRPYKVVKYATDITARKRAIAKIRNVLMSLSKGDLTKSIDQELVGEFQVIGTSLNEFITTLRSLVTNIRTTSASVFESSREIASGNNELSVRTEAQASRLEQTSSAMEQLSSTVQLNAENATRASGLSSSVMQKANDGGNVVANTIQAMQAINQSSKKIADIIGVINEIAFQTNLLALNAAVEAARAGEQGRGFAVVAAEVRNLAQRSGSAAKEIKELINDSVTAVDRGTKFVGQTKDTFKELFHSIEEVSEMIADIDNAGKEQSTGIKEVTIAVSQMDDMTQQNAALVEEAAAASQSMSDQAQNLINQIDFFNDGQKQYH